jgi:hypothetical protein
VYNSNGWNVTRLVDLTAPGPRALSPRGPRFVAADGTVLKVKDLLFFGPDVDIHPSFDAEMHLPGKLRRVKVQLDMSRFSGELGEIVIRSRGASALRPIDAETWYSAARSSLDAIYTPAPAALHSVETEDEAVDEEDQAAA